MNKTKIAIPCLIIACLVTSINCAGHCISVGGKYEGIEGSIEYCLNQEKTKTEGVPVLESSEGESVFGIPEKIIDEIIGALAGGSGSETKKQESAGGKYQTLREALQKKR